MSESVSLSLLCSLTDWSAALCAANCPSPSSLPLVKQTVPFSAAAARSRVPQHQSRKSAITDMHASDR